eukprot:10803044-Ditylum_brightwellii.AAC.1
MKKEWNPKEKGHVQEKRRNLHSEIPSMMMVLHIHSPQRTPSGIKYAIFTHLLDAADDELTNIILEEMEEEDTDEEGVEPK